MPEDEWELGDLAVCVQLNTTGVWTTSAGEQESPGPKSGELVLVTGIAVYPDGREGLQFFEYPAACFVSDCFMKATPPEDMVLENEERYG